ncbi:MAG: PH domain-containing protein [Syntrophorhabdaceae bacterium]|nr:PH domain-containing protein [Syntrophorhabdaceae bacterium]
MSDVYIAKCHWAILLGPMMVFFIGLITVGSAGFHSISIMAFGVIWGIFSYKNLTKSEIRLCEDRLLINKGYPLEKSYDIPLEDVVFIDFYQPSLGSILNFGKVTIVYDREKKQCTMRFIKKPEEFVGMVKRQVNSFRTPEIR